MWICRTHKRRQGYGTKNPELRQTQQDNPAGTGTGEDGSEKPSAAFREPKTRARANAAKPCNRHAKRPLNDEGSFQRFVAANGTTWVGWQLLVEHKRHVLPSELGEGFVVMASTMLADQAVLVGQAALRE